MGINLFFCQLSDKAFTTKWKSFVLYVFSLKHARTLKKGGTQKVCQL